MPTREPSRSPARGGRLAGVACWSSVVALAVPPAARVVGLDDDAIVLIAAAAAAPWVALLACLVALCSAATRRHVALLMSLVVAAGYVIWLWPFSVDGPRLLRSAPLTILSVNALYTNTQTTRLAEDLVRVKADLLAVVELRPQLSDQLTHSGAFAFRYVLPQRNSRGIGVWSRVPVKSVRVVDMAGSPALQVRLDVESTPITVWVVHPEGPVSDQGRRRWSAQLGRLQQLMRGQPVRPTVVVGDFNAAPTNSPFAAVLRTGLDDAALRLGRPFAMTWPAGWPVLPPFLRLDHVLVSRDVGVRSQRVLAGAGTDHLFLVTRLLVGLPASTQCAGCSAAIHPATPRAAPRRQTIVPVGPAAAGGA